MNQEQEEQAIEAYRDKYALELFNKHEWQLDTGENWRLDEYIKDIRNPEWRVVDVGMGINVEVNQTGTIVRDPVTKKEYHISFTKHKDGRHNYLMIGVRIPEENKNVPRLVHRLVAQAFVPNPENKPEVNHIDGNKWNSWYKNLEWVTDSENKLHAFRTGLAPSHAGEKSPTAKYTTEQIVEVCNLLEGNPDITFKEIAKITGVPKGTISSIYFGKNWTIISKDYDFPKRNTQVKGERSHLAKNTRENIEKACCLLDDIYLGKANWTHQQIADMVGISKASVDNLIGGNIWKDIVSKHQFTNSKPYVGEAVKSSKYSSEQVESICKMLKEHPEWSNNQIAELAKVKPHLVYEIYEGTAWKHISQKYMPFPTRTAIRKSRKNE